MSVKQFGGKESDYYNLHDFFDTSKEVEATNKHRILSHHMLWVKQVIIPIYGSSFINSDGQEVNTKDLCEMSHLLPDFGGKFIPTLSDYIDCVSDDPTDQATIDKFQDDNKRFFKKNPQINELMLSPLYNTGKVKSLFITHNSWFVGFILPKVFKDIQIEIKEYNISPQTLMARTTFANWMNNGRGGVPPSFEKIYNKKREKQNIHLTLPQPSDMVFDGSRKDIPSIAPFAPKFDDGAGPVDITTKLRD